MKRLIEKGLMFGGLVPVEGVLVERYRRALRHLTGRETALEDFHVDISGYSPEVGDELSDDRYLNPEGLNRQFILVDLGQKEAPLLNAEFSTSRAILRRFIDENEAQLFALTARDAVAGELVGSVYGVDRPARLLDIRQVTVEADTTTGTLATAEKLEGLIRRFREEPDAWWDDVLIAEMIGLAQRTGDLRRNPVALKSKTFAQGDFWTSMFGGLYVLRDVREPGVVAVDPAQVDEMRVPVIALSDRTGVARWLSANELVEPVVRERGPATAAILRQKMDFVAAAAAAAKGLLPEGAGRREVRALSRRLGRDLPEEWQGLASLAAWAEEGAAWPRITSDHPAYFYTLRAKAGPDAELVNRLLSELAPLDVRQLFICHKEAFYRLYRSWPEAQRAWVADVLATEYMVDKAGTRAALFGPEAPMEEPAPAPAGPWAAAPRATDALIDQVGPWGSVRRR